MNNTFGIPIIPSDDNERVATLHSYNILDTPPEWNFDNLVNVVAQCLNMPIAIISLVDKERVFFKARLGLESKEDVPRGVSLCSLAILETDITIFEDALKEPCLLANPMVAGEFGLRFYAGAPIINENGYAIGTVCVIDKKPREFSEADQDLLTRFATATMNAITRRKEMMEAVHS